MFDVLDAWLRLSAERIRQAAPDLTALDQAIGDGDHGTNMDRGFGAIVAQLTPGRQKRRAIGRSPGPSSRQQGGR